MATVPWDDIFDLFFYGGTGRAGSEPQVPESKTGGRILVALLCIFVIALALYAKSTEGLLLVAAILVGYLVWISRLLLRSN